MLIRRLDRYFFLESFPSFIGGVFFISFVLLMFQALRLSDFLIVHQVPAALVGEIAFFLVISFFPFVIPFAFLFSILTAFGRLSSESELIAFQSVGYRPLQLAMPFFKFAFFLTVLSYFLHMTWIPQAADVSKKLLMQVEDSQVVHALKPGAFTSGFFGLTVFVDRLEAEQKTWKHVFIFDSREPKSQVAILADRAFIESQEGRHVLERASMFHLLQGQMHRVSGQMQQLIEFGKYALFLRAKIGKDRSIVKPMRLTLKQIQNRLLHWGADTGTYRQAYTELWRRYAMIGLPFVLIFLGMGLGTARNRSVKLSAFLLVFLVAISFYALQSVLIDWSRSGSVPAPFAMVFLDFLFLVIGVFFYKRVFS